MPELTRQGGGGTLRDVLFVVFRHRRKALVFLATALAAAGIVTALTPKVYRSEARLLLRVGHESATTDPMAARGEAPARRPWENEINSELEILKSGDLAETVVSEVGPAAVLGAGRATGDAAPSAEIVEAAVTQFRENLSIEVLRGTSVIALSFDAPSPEAAKKVLDRLIEDYRVKHIDVYRSSGSHKFFEEQKDATQRRLGETEERLRELKNASGIASLEDQRRIVLDRVGGLRTQIEQTGAALEASKAKIRTLEESLRRTPKTVVRESTTLPNSSVDEMRKEVYALKLREQELLSMYREESDVVRDIRRRIAAAEEEVAKQEPTRSEVTQGLNETYQKMSSQLFDEKASWAAQQAQLKALRADLERAERDRTHLNDEEAKIASLERQKQAQETNLLEYSSKLEDTRIAQELERDRISNISVVQPADLPLWPVRPRVPLNLALGLAIGLLGAVGISFVTEYLDHTIKRPQDVEDRLQLPMLLALPRLEPAVVAALEKGGPNTPREIKDYFDVLRDRILLYGDGSLQPPAIIAVTSCYRDEGVSTVASHLAAALARAGKGRVLLINGKVIREFAGEMRLQPQARWLAPDSESSSEANRALPARRFAHLAPQLKREYGFVVLEAPAIIEAGCPDVLASLADGILFVIEAERVRWEAAQHALELLARSRARVLGAVLNKRQYHIPGWLYGRL